MNALDDSNICGIIGIFLLLWIIQTIGYENLSKRTQSVLARISRKIMRLRLENPVITFNYVHTSGEEQRQNAILDWLHG